MSYLFSSILIDSKYASLLSSRVRNFKLKGYNHFNFSCDVCGDSKTNKRKARFYIFPSKTGNRLFCTCQNCGYNSSLRQYLKLHHVDIFQEYSVEQFQNVKSEYNEKQFVKIVRPHKSLDHAFKISSLRHDHPARLYVDSRKIPTQAHSRLYYVPNFPLWINSLLPQKFEEPPKRDPRLVLPFFDRKGELFAIQGRTLINAQPRYITIKLDEDVPKIYGLDKIDPNRRTYVVEGPIDSLFIPNALAMAGAYCTLEDLIHVSHCDKQRLVFVMDNQPRNPQVVARIDKLINQGVKVCIWPKKFEEKDINDAVKNGKDPADILQLIDDNTFWGLEAQLELAQWRKDL